jgi:hypothetical protein
MPKAFAYRIRLRNRHYSFGSAPGEKDPTRFTDFQAGKTARGNLQLVCNNGGWWESAVATKVATRIFWVLTGFKVPSGYPRTPVPRKDPLIFSTHASRLWRYHSFGGSR